MSDLCFMPSSKTATSLDMSTLTLVHNVYIFLLKWYYQCPIFQRQDMKLPITTHPYYHFIFTDLKKKFQFNGDWTLICIYLIPIGF